MSETINVANADTFFDAYASLPKAQQKKVREFMPKFRANPRSSGINYERINGANPDYRSVRIDQTYRCIVLAPKRGNTYVLLWVAHHDDAYDWAARKHVEINPTTGTLQIFETEPVAAPEAVSDAVAAPPAGEPPSVEPSAPPPTVTDEADAAIVPAPVPQPMPNGPPFALDEDQLRLVGVPEPLLAPVLALGDGPALEAMEGRLPVEAYEALTLYGHGLTWEEIVAECASETTGPIDTDDLDAALARDASKRRFHVVESDESLEAMLAAPLEKWRVYLHPSQRKLVEWDWNGPVRVTGGAGTGKTVVAMHRAAWLVRHLTETDKGADQGSGPGADKGADRGAGRGGPRVLFLTYNVNLAADIGESLRTLVAPGELADIEVANIDAWASRFLKARGHQRQIRYEGGLDELWNEVLDLSMPELDKPLPRSFYLEEWERVVQPNRILDRDAYLRVSRAGRGVALSRRQRAAVWDVFDAMRGELAKRGWQTWNDAMLDAADELASASGSLGYRHVIVDETQDMGPEALRLIRAIVPEGPNDLFFVGDGHQRIYRRRAVMGQCGIRIVGRSRKLKVNYRTTEEICRFASAVLQGLEIDDLDGGDDTGPGYLSLTRGPVPVFVAADSQADEIRAIAGRLRTIVDGGGELRDCCVMLRSVALRDRYYEALRAEGLDAVLLQRRADNRLVPGVRVCNMHRVKGLEFRHVVIASMRDGVVPNRLAVEGSEDGTELRDRDLAERALVHVCASRAIESLAVTWYGTPSEYLQVVDGSE